MIEWLRARPADPTIELAGRVVPIAVTRHPRARRLTLRLTHDGGAVRLTVPRWCRSADALAFAAARRDWLEAQLVAIPPRADPVARGTLRYRGRELAIAWNPDAPRRPLLLGDTIALGGAYESVAKRLVRWLESEATRLAQSDLAEYCSRIGRPLPQLRLTRAVRRWGSCSTTGTIRINWRLIMAPDGVRRSVVAHEVAHLVHFDHGPAFYSLLETLFEGDIAVADAWLRSHGRALYADFA